jgi:hypothetical protein
VLSVYLNVDPADPDHQRTPPAYRIWLKNALDAIDVNGAHDAKKSFRQLVERVNDRFVDFRPNGKGVALFAAPGVWQELNLPVSVANHVHYGRTDAAPLLWLLDEYERYGIVQVSHREARLLTAFLGRPESSDQLHLELDTSDWRRKVLMPSGGFGSRLTEGSMRDAFEDRVHEEQRTFWRDVADEVRGWVDAAGLDRLVVGGNEEAAAEFLALLPPPLAAKVIDVLPLPFEEGEAETLERVRPRAEAYERRREEELVEGVVTAALSGGQGALGVADVLGALQEGRAMTVVAGWPVEGQVWHCPSCDLVLAQAVERCPACGGPVERRALATTLPRLARRTSAEVELVHGSPAERLRPHGGLAAALRY